MPGKIFVILISVLLLALIGEASWLYFLRQSSTAAPVNEFSSTSTPVVYFSKLDGTAVSSSEKIVPQVLGIMVDNHPDSRPQSGLSEARVVYEAPVEGGITRYFALFSSEDKVDKVGPVRSARPYFLDWLAEYGNASYWHSGGSPEALRLIGLFNVRDVNEFSWENYYWREKNRFAPHNLYTNSEKWSRFYEKYPKDEKDWKGWNFDVLNSSSTPTKQMKILYDKNYEVGWTYDEGLQKYGREINGKTIFDQGGVKIMAGTVVVQEMEIEIIDEVGRREAETIGEGKARVLRDGQLVRATWKKETRNSKTKFFDEKGEEINFKPGQIWIQVVPVNTSIEISN